MEKSEAIKASKKGTATNISHQGMYKITRIAYKDGSGFVMYSQNGKVDFFLSRPMTPLELKFKADWQPS